MDITVSRVDEGVTETWIFSAEPSDEAQPTARLALVSYEKVEEKRRQAAKVTAVWAPGDEDIPIEDQLDNRDVPVPADVIREARSTLMRDVRTAIAAYINPVVVPIDYAPEQAGK